MALPGSTPIALLSYGQGTKEHLQEVNLYHYGRRFYDPKQGRFIGRDPIQEEGGINLYAFVKNQPLNRWNRLGLCDNLDATTGACLTERPADLLSYRMDPFIALTTPYKTVVYAPGAISALAFAAGGVASGQTSVGGINNANNLDRWPEEKCRELKTQVDDLSQALVSGRRTIDGISNLIDQQIIVSRAVGVVLDDMEVDLALSATGVGLSIAAIPIEGVGYLSGGSLLVSVVSLHRNSTAQRNYYRSNAAPVAQLLRALFQARNDLAHHVNGLSNKIELLNGQYKDHCD